MKLRKSILWLLAVVMFFTMLVVPTTEVNAANTAKTLKITKATNSTAKKIDKYLLKGTPIVIKVSGSVSTSEKKVKKLQKLIKEVNKQGVIFQYEKGDKVGKYYTYVISKDNAKLYKYSVEFIKKLFSKFKNGGNLPSGFWYDGKYGEGYKTINGITEFRFFYEMYKLHKKLNIDLDYAEFIKTKTEDFIFGLEDKHIETQASIYKKAFSANSFSELSDAMKVWVISASGYFNCNFSRNEVGAIRYEKSSFFQDPWVKGGYNIFGMIYRTDEQTYFYEDWKRMRALSKNNVQGVCATFASYEKLVFDQLGIDAYENSSWEINHAWVVVKVKNSKGKTLWIPFDYGIGPAINLSVSEEVRQKYINTEKKRYKLYLQGIKGAPKKRNFTQKDFN
ncbi:MAG: hypothetical protein IJC76_00740 [Lachnospiraceae bacterium]|nr:hypothetical protein [Lachnospiraceae bacterium]